MPIVLTVTNAPTVICVTPSLTVERVSGQSERTDYNDYRIFGGIQWYNRATTLKGFVEAGWAFERELVYAQTDDDLGLSDTFMLRAGIAY